MTLYKSIAIWPLPTSQNMLLLPIWRLADTDCNLIIECHLDNLKMGYGALELWGFVYTKTIPRMGKLQHFFICATRGNPPEVQITASHRTAYRALSLLPGPRLAINSKYYKPGWNVWREDFYNIEDIYRYPIRKDYVNVDPQMLFLSYMLRKAILEEKKARWHIGDTIKLMVDCGLFVDTALQYAAECTGYSISNVRLFYTIAGRVPEKERDYDRSWLSYRQELGMWERSKDEIQQRTRTKLSDVGFSRRGSVETDVPV